MTRDPRTPRGRTTTLLPRVLVNTGDLAAGVGEPAVAGAVWKLPASERDLDSNIIALPPGGTIEEHVGPDVDVLVHVLAGSGTLFTARDSLDLVPGALLWLPRHSRRRLAASHEGLRYLTVHRRRQALVVESAPPPAV
ncbi:hypothetical protein [Pseudofrankia saprophytica]|uniref:hypothetical protein n=1 Tax=Pseudofrankia saprophytica TaxID=298655 RepID=UPI000234B207|nr:hypothetical protein [Pseudofrankia saprophytica]